MATWKCRVTVEDTVEADTKEEAQESFLQMVDEMGASNWNIPRDVEAEKED